MWGSKRAGYTRALQRHCVTTVLQSPIAGREKKRERKRRLSPGGGVSRGRRGGKEATSRAASRGVWRDKVDYEGTMQPPLTCWHTTKL